MAVAAGDFHCRTAAAIPVYFAPTRASAQTTIAHPAGGAVAEYAGGNHAVVQAPVPFAAVSS